jgi:hypothetical protein
MRSQGNDASLVPRLEKQQPVDGDKLDFCAGKVLRRLPPGDSHRGPGIYSGWLLNLRRLISDKSILQSVGVLHAYFEAGSVGPTRDPYNVLRGGATPKYLGVGKQVCKL